MKGGMIRDEMFNSYAWCAKGTKVRMYWNEIFFILFCMTCSIKNVRAKRFGDGNCREIKF